MPGPIASAIIPTPPKINNSINKIRIITAIMFFNSKLSPYLLPFRYIAETVVSVAIRIHRRSVYLHGVAGNLRCGAVARKVFKEILF